MGEWPPRTGDASWYEQDGGGEVEEIKERTANVDVPPVHREPGEVERSVDPLARDEVEPELRVVPARRIVTFG